MPDQKSLQAAQNQQLGLHAGNMPGSPGDVHSIDFRLFSLPLSAPDSRWTEPEEFIITHWHIYHLFRGLDLGLIESDLRWPSHGLQEVHLRRFAYSAYGSFLVCKDGAACVVIMSQVTTVNRNQYLSS